MLTSRGSCIEDHFYIGTLNDDPQCEECGRSIVTAKGEPLAPQFCDSCEADFRLLHAAGKMVMDGWSLVVVKIGDDRQV